MIVRGGYVNLVDYSGSDEYIVRAARQSTTVLDPSVEVKRRSTSAAIRHMMRLRHMGPFEHAFLSFEVLAPFYLISQWVRHRTGSYSIMSRRNGKKVDTNFYLAPVEEYGDIPNAEAYRLRQLNDMRRAYETYEEMLKAGFSNEVAGRHLPLAGNRTMTYSAKLRNVLEFLDLRLRADVEPEMRDYARAVYELTRQVYPLTVAAWVEYNLVPDEELKSYLTTA